MSVQPSRKIPSIEDSCFRSVGERLSYFRHQAGLSLSATAAATGISSAELCRLEKGKRRLSRRHALLLSDAYSVAPGSFADILRYEPSDHIARIDHGGYSQYFDLRSLCSLPLKSRDTSINNADRIQLCVEMPLSAAAYCLRLDEVTGLLEISDDSIAVVDPGARTVLGDLVIAQSGMMLTVMRIKRDETGELFGESGNYAVMICNADTSVTAFEKIVAIFPAAYLLQPS